MTSYLRYQNYVERMRSQLFLLNRQIYWIFVNENVIQQKSLSFVNDPTQITQLHLNFS